MGVGGGEAQKVSLFSLTPYKKKKQKQKQQKKPMKTNK